MNARSRIYLRENRSLPRKIADDKLQTKTILAENNLSSAELITVLHDRNEVGNFDWDSLPDSFVLKPSRGLGGEGIIIVFNRLKNGNWLTTNKQELTAQDLEAHVLNVLDGNYSLSNVPDVALFEERLSIDPLYKRFSKHGIPDIRVIVYRNVPVMAMLRLATKKSRGKANLMQGGLGVGIDIATGLTNHVVQKSWLYERELERHPDTNAELRGVKVPYWDDILLLAVRSANAIGLQYAGVDISVDKKRGPVVLELNARPGLGIQVANMAPLRDRLRRIRGLNVKTPERGISIAKDLFAGQFDDEISALTGRIIVGLIEPAKLVGKDDKEKKILAKIDTGARSSSINESLARELGFGQAIDVFQSQVEKIPGDLDKEAADDFVKEMEPALKKAHKDIAGISAVSSSHGLSIRMNIKLRMTIAGKTIRFNPNVYDRSHMTYSLLVGASDLTHFLVDPTKKTVRKKKHTTKQEMKKEKKKDTKTKAE